MLPSLHSVQELPVALVALCSACSNGERGGERRLFISATLQHNKWFRNGRGVGGKTRACRQGVDSAKNIADNLVVGPSTQIWLHAI